MPLTTGEPPNPKVEFLMAAAGPILSIGLGVLCYIVLQIGLFYGWPSSINAIINYLSKINFVLGIFNLLPGYPLDGGRMLRAILWEWKGDLEWATRIASKGGTWLGFLLIFFSIFQFIQGAFISGLWTFLIGLFIWNLSKLSYYQFVIRGTFHDEPIRKYVRRNPVCVGPDITIQDLLNNYVYEHYHKLYPVVDNEQLLGVITFNKIKEIEQEKWSSVTVKQVMSACSQNNTINADVDVATTLSRMNTQGIGRLVVIERGKLYGIITLKDLMNVVFMKLELKKQ